MIDIDAVDWTAWRTQCGDASRVPAAVERLFAADKATREVGNGLGVDNSAVVQGTLYPAAYPAALLIEREIVARRAMVGEDVLDVLYELGCARCRVEEFEIHPTAPPGLGLYRACRNVVRRVVTHLNEHPEQLLHESRTELNMADLNEDIWDSEIVAG